MNFCFILVLSLFYPCFILVLFLFYPYFIILDILNHSISLITLKFIIKFNPITMLFNLTDNFNKKN